MGYQAIVDGNNVFKNTDIVCSQSFITNMAFASRTRGKLFCRKKTESVANWNEKPFDPINKVRAFRLSFRIVHIKTCVSGSIIRIILELQC